MFGGHISGAGNSGIRTEVSNLILCFFLQNWVWGLGGGHLPYSSGPSTLGYNCLVIWPEEQQTRYWPGLVKPFQPIPILSGDQIFKKCMSLFVEVSTHLIEKNSWLTRTQKTIFFKTLPFQSNIMGGLLCLKCGTNLQSKQCKAKKKLHQHDEKKNARPTCNWK